MVKRKTLKVRSNIGPTVRELKAEIRRVVSDMNQLIERQAKTEIYKADKAATESKIKALQSRYGVGRKGLFALRFNRATKAQLLTKLSEFESFNEFIKTTIENNPKSTDEKLRKQFESFSKNSGYTMSFDEYRDMTNILGAIGDSILNKYGSQNIVELYKATEAGKRGNLLDVILSTYRGARGKSLTAEQLLDRVYERLEEL